MSAESDIEIPEPTGDKRGHKPRERRCVASGEVRDPDLMVRFVRAPDGMVVADVNNKLPGRGVWVSADATSLRKAATSGGFARGFKAKTTVDADALVDHTRQQLRRRLLGRLTMARKAGRLAFGHSSVRELASRGDVALRVEARDGAPDGRGKLRTLSLATARELERRDPPVIGLFTAEEIGVALGRDPVVHAALQTGPMVRDVMGCARQLSGFEPLVPPDWDDAHHEVAFDPPDKRPRHRDGPS